MTLGLTPEQQELSDAVGQFAARHAPIAATRDSFDYAGRRAAARHGGMRWSPTAFTRFICPRSLGGQGGRLIDAACVLESAAKALLPGPLLPTVTAGAVALLADPTPAAESLVRDLASGVPAAVVLPDDGDFQARADGQRWLVTGARRSPRASCAARVILVGARTDDGDVVWVPVDTGKPAATVESVHGTDLVADVGILRLADYCAAESDVLTGIDPDRAECVAVGLVASTTAGIAQWCVEAVTAHLRTREQFGKVIGTFQALQHSAAMLLVNSELATAAAWDAVRAADEPPRPAPPRRGRGGDDRDLAGPGPGARRPDDVRRHRFHLGTRRAPVLAAGHQPGGIDRPGQSLGPAAGATGLHPAARHVGQSGSHAESDFRSWVAETLDAAMQLRNDKPGPHGDYEDLATGPQRTLIADAGLIAPHWPAPWGVDAGPLKQLIIDEEFAKRPGLVRPSLDIAEWILPSVLAAAPKELQESLIPATQRGDIAWCQLFSEPGAGSDLASLATRATKVDGGWQINGHKIWTSLAQYADFGGAAGAHRPRRPASTAASATSSSTCDPRG